MPIQPGNDLVYEFVVGSELPQAFCMMTHQLCLFQLVHLFGVGFLVGPPLL